MAGQAGTFRLPSVASRKVGSVATDIIEVAEADYKYVLRSIAAQEVARQQSIGNKPTSISVDGSATKPIDQAERAIIVRFFQPEALVRAVREAWDAIYRIARVGDPGQQRPRQRPLVARESFVVTVGRRAVGDPRHISESMIAADPTAPVRIVGPVVPYARKYRFMFFLRGTPSRLVKKRGEAERRRVPQSIHQIVVQRMRRKYPQFRWSDAWLQLSRPMGRVDRVPTITVRDAPRKGRLL